jgi:acyl-coenzyme A thioesterase PaaI-like protein
LWFCYAKIIHKAPTYKLRLNSALGVALTTMPSAAEIANFLDHEFPQTKCTVEAVGNRLATVRHEVGVAELRPGGTVSGPVLMAVADVALYVAILGEIGIVPLAVTTNLNINFLRKPSASAAIIGKCRLLKLGKSLAVGEVNLFSEGSEEPVAHVVGTYSIPPSAQASSK